MLKYKVFDKKYRMYLWAYNWFGVRLSSFISYFEVEGKFGEREEVFFYPLVAFPELKNMIKILNAKPTLKTKTQLVSNITEVQMLHMLIVNTFSNKCIIFRISS